MNPLVFHIVSGQSFFTGIVLLVAAAFLSLRSDRASYRIGFVLFALGILAVGLSSTAIPVWSYVVAGVFTAVWIASKFQKEWRQWAAWAMAAGWLVAAAVEIPNLAMPVLVPSGGRSLTIIGDSVTAGIGADDTSQTWPLLLADQHNLRVQDISHMGETAKSALIRVQEHPVDSSLVLLEIGGNDVLGSTSADEFESTLNDLVQRVTQVDRQLVMFELPVPPGFHAYCYAQRRIASRYGVKLIPKRVFLSILAEGGSTLDSVHLSQQGHQNMADQVWRILGPAFK